MKAFITITGLKFHFGSKPFEVGQKVKLVKEPDNEYDSEAIKAELPGLGCAGYVANSPHTVLGDCVCKILVEHTFILCCGVQLKILALGIR